MEEAEKKVPLKLKLVIDKRKNRVLFAEARKCFVDFVFHILSLPLGTVAKVLSEVDESGAGSLGCLGRLYEGVKILDDYYISPSLKRCLLESSARFFCAASLGLLPETSLPSVRVFRQCSNYPSSVRLFSDKQQLNLPSPCWRCGYDRCSRQPISLAGDPADLLVVNLGDEGGYVKWDAVFMVMDDLHVEPMSAVSVLSLMGSKDLVCNFVNKEVDFGRDEALKLLKASLQSKTVLTDVFLKGCAQKGSIKTEC